MRCPQCQHSAVPTPYRGADWYHCYYSEGGCGNSFKALPPPAIPPLSAGELAFFMLATVQVIREHPELHQEGEG